MGLLTRLGFWGRRRSLGVAQRERLDAIQRDSLCPADSGIDSMRFVVVDVESTGLDIFSDRLIAIGAVSVVEGALQVASSHYNVLRQNAPSAVDNILVHGIGGTEQTAGIDPVEGLLAFAEYTASAPLVAYHADFDRAMIHRACREYLGTELKFRWLDLAQLAPALFPQFANQRRALDDWTTPLGIENLNRHNAVADAAATAQLLLVLLARARVQGLQTLGALLTLEKNQRWLGRQP